VGNIVDTLFGRAKRTILLSIALSCIVLSLGSASAASSVTLAWDPSTSPDVAGYNIYYGTTSGSYPSKVSLGNVTTTTISSLVAGTTYYFVATAYNSLGLESTPSNELPYTVPTAPANSTNQPPTLNLINAVTINENSGQQTVNLSGITSGAANENQNLTVTAASSNPTLVPNPTVNYVSPNTSGTLSFTPVANASGATTITVIVNDNQSQNNLISCSFTVTLNPTDSGQSSTTVTNQFVPGSGTYNGLFYEDDGVQQASAGSFTLTVSTKGSYSGKIQIGSGKYSFSGKTNSAGFITNTITRKGTTPLTIVLWTDGSNPSSQQISGQLTDGTWISTLCGDKAMFSNTNPAPFAGSYTMVIPQDKDQPLPMGYGFGTLTVSSSGVAKFTGTLADGTSISQSATISGVGLWPLYIPLYSGRGSAISWISFTNHPSYDLSGTLSWINPSNPNAKFYSTGFTNETCAIGSTFIAPVGNPPYTNILVNGMAFSDAYPGSALPPISISTKNGTFKFSAKNSATNMKISYGGVIFQKMNAGYGMYLDSDQTSKSVVIAP